MADADRGESQDKIIELSELVGGLAHEIRNPLSSLKVHLQLLAEELREDPDGQYMDPDLRRRTLQRLTTLRGEVERMQRMFDSFLKLVSRHDIDLEAADINGVVETLVDFIKPKAQEQSIEIRTRLADMPLVCRIDHATIRQAILNLCLNAQEAMPRGGSLIITTQGENGMARIEVADTGVGIEPQVVERIFTPFFSTKKDGTGLGLSLTKRIIEQHRGTLSVASAPDQGTSFTIRLPLHEAADLSKMSPDE